VVKEKEVAGFSIPKRFRFLVGTLHLMVNIDPDLLNNAFTFFVAYYKEYRKGVDTDIEYFFQAVRKI